MPSWTISERSLRAGLDCSSTTEGWIAWHRFSAIASKRLEEELRPLTSRRSHPVPTDVRSYVHWRATLRSPKPISFDAQIISAYSRRLPCPPGFASGIRPPNSPSFPPLPPPQPHL